MVTRVHVRRGESLIFLLAGPQPALFPKPAPGTFVWGTFQNLIQQSREHLAPPYTLSHDPWRSLLAVTVARDSRWLPRRASALQTLQLFPALQCGGAKKGSKVEGQWM